MKCKLTLILIGFLILTSHDFFAQDLNVNVVGGAYPSNGSETPCLTTAQREIVLADIRNGIQQLKQQNRLAFSDAHRDGAHPLFGWPLRKAAGITYNDIYTARYYVDQNMAYPNQVSDFDCGTRTYDTAAGYNHAGTDLVTWPFGWKMIDLNGVEIVAAAPGQILYKMASQFDRSCTNNDNFWNTVYIRHADGSVAVYGHMKQNSLTTKNVGDMVSEGEFLGIVGSSGNSAVPHLHFEVYSEIEWNGEGVDVLIDPYAGACNSLNSDSWWQNQRPKNNPNINAVLTHTDIPVFPECPQPEITYESDDFDASDLIHFAVYLRDQVAGTSLNLKIIRPDDSILYNWNHALTDNYDSSWWLWYYAGVYNMNGQWKWQVTYMGQTVTHNFNVTGALGIGEENFNTTSVYPNPFKNRITIASKTTVQKATITDVLGKTVLIETNTSEGITEINLETLSKGIYFLTLEGDSKQKKTIKLIKE